MTTPRRGRKSISENVWILQNTLVKILSDDDRTFLIHSLNQYQRDRDILLLVESLKRVLDTPKKREVYPLLWEIIPSSDKRYFERAWQTNRRHQQSNGSWNNSSSIGARFSNLSQERLRRSQIYSSLPENLDKCDSGIELPVLKKSVSSRSFQKYPIRHLYLKRAQGTGYGFCMRGGSDHGVGLYVSSVDENSIAEYEGLLPGDHILSVNEIQFDGLSHDQAVKIIKNSKKLNMVVRSVGRIPNTFVAESTYKWINPLGQRVSPPPNVDSNGRVISVDGIHRSDLRLLGDDDERKVNVLIEDDGKLGLKIRGGSEYGLGIYIAYVDPNSAAQKAGLKCGDQIMDVNGISFLNITHADAVKVLKSARNMMVTMKDVGRLPFAKTVKDKTKWSKGKLHQLPSNAMQSDAESILTTTTAQVHEPPDIRRHTTSQSSRFQTERTEISKFQHGIAGSQLLYNGTGPSTKCLAEDQARQVLNENELGTLNYYMDEYCNGFIAVDAFVLALFSLFNTPSKVSLVTEVRGSIHPRDIDRFDDLVLKKEIEAIKKRKIPSPKPGDDTHSIRSYSSSVSSFSEQGSTSSRSSAKESLDSRPITPPHVPEELPKNIKVLQHTYENTEKGLPCLMTSDDTLKDRDSIPSPPTDFTTVFPLSSSSPREPTPNAVTNGEITQNLVIGDNIRIKDTPRKNHDPEEPNQHSEKMESTSKNNLDNTILEKEPAKNVLQSSSNQSFKLVSEAKKEKRGFFHLNKGSYSPSKHNNSITSKESSNLYHVKIVKKKDEQNIGGSPEHGSFVKVGEELGNHVETSSNISSKAKPYLVSGDNVDQSNDSGNEKDSYDSTVVGNGEKNVPSPKLMNGYCTSTKKQTNDNILPNKLDLAKANSNAARKHSSAPEDPLIHKPYHAKTEGQNMEGSFGSLEGNQSLKSVSQSNSPFAPPKPKPYISQGPDRTTTNLSKEDGDQRNNNTQDDVETTRAPPMPQPYIPPETNLARENPFNEHYLSCKENDYVDIDSIRRSKNFSHQKSKSLEKSIGGDKVEHEYVDPKVIDLTAAASSPLKPKPYSSKEEENATNTHNNGNPNNMETQLRTDPHVTSQLYHNKIQPPVPESYSPKLENNLAEKNGSNTDIVVRNSEESEAQLECKNDGNTPKSIPNSLKMRKSSVDKNDSRKNMRLSNGIDTPKPKVFELEGSDQGQLYGMFLAMEETATTRSGLEKSASWGEESVPSDSRDIVCGTKSVRQSEKLSGLNKPKQEDILRKNSIHAQKSNTLVVSNHDNKIMMGNEKPDTPDKGEKKTEVTTGGHDTPKFDNIKGRGTSISSNKEHNNVTTPEKATKGDILDHDAPIKYDVNQNNEEAPQKSVLSKIKAYNRMVDTSNTGSHLYSRKESAANRKSWDGVANHLTTGQEQRAMVEKKKSLISNSDSNLMNLPKEQKKSIQVKLRASQELLELRQQSRESSTTNSRRNSVEKDLPTEPTSVTALPSTSNTPQSRDGHQRYDVEIDKTSKGLGLILEGGSDTSSRNAPVKIKLIKIHRPVFSSGFHSIPEEYIPDNDGRIVVQRKPTRNALSKEGPYAAYRCGKLRPGQSILQINDRPIQGMTNAMAILTLRQAYSDPETKTLLLSVKDP